MNITLLSGKIHRVKVTQSELDYVGSITIDSSLLSAAGIMEYEKVCVVNINNGKRLETYAIAGEKDSGMLCLNGAAARYAQVNDKVIIMAYAQMTREEALTHRPKVVFVDENNRISHVTSYEKHGQIVK
jgi:aspartate 1-decarboxylase